MTTIGVRELRQQTSEVLRKIREEKAEYIIIYQGQPIAGGAPASTCARAHAARGIEGFSAAPYAAGADVSCVSWRLGVRS